MKVVTNPTLFLSASDPTVVTVNDIDIELPDLDLAGLVFDKNEETAKKACMLWRSRHKRNEMFNDQAMRITHLHAFADEDDDNL